MIDSQAMLDKVWFILPEIWLFGGAVVVSMMGLSRRKLLRDAVPFVVCFFLAAAMAAIPGFTPTRCGSPARTCSCRSWVPT